MSETPKDIAEACERGPIYWNDCEAALIGVLHCADGVQRAVYQYEKLLDVFMEMGMDETDAMEYIEFNIAGAYVGPATPLLAGWRWPDVITELADA